MAIKQRMVGLSFYLTPDDAAKVDDIVKQTGQRQSEVLRMIFFRGIKTLEVANSPAK